MGLFDFLGDVGGFLGGIAASPVKGFANAVTTQTNSVPSYIGAPQLQSNPYTDRYQEIAAQLAGQGAQMNGYAQNGAQSQGRAQQQSFNDYLLAQAQGQGPSAAGMLLNQGLDRSMANTNAIAASARGNVNPALLQRQAMTQNANSAQSVGQQAAVARMQEMQAAQGLAGQNLAATRQQDIQNAGLYNSLGLNYADLARGYENSGLTAAQSNQQAQAQTNQLNAGIATGNTEMINKTVGGLMNAAGGAAAAAAMSHGGIVPGKAQVEGDSPTNDRVPVLASPGEIVIPRSKSKDSAKAKAFIDEIMSKKKPSSGRNGFSEVLEAQRMLNSKINALQKKLGKAK